MKDHVLYYLSIGRKTDWFKTEKRLSVFIYFIYNSILEGGFQLINRNTNEYDNT